MKRIAITGASGYVGGRLLRRLREEELPVVCLARNPDFLRPRVGMATPILQADVLDKASLVRALRGIGTAYYFVHSMGARKSFEPLDREGAKNFSEACKHVGVERIVYLGGLGHGADLSLHLRSRNEVGEILRASGVPTIEFRASIILGSGSISFELIRATVEKLPIMLAPKWVRTQTQPIAVEDIIEYLAQALMISPEWAKIYEIGGPDVVSYEDLASEYARQRGLVRWILPVPILGPRFWSLWLGLITPVFARVGRKLIESLQNKTVIEDHSATSCFTVHPMSMKEAIARALTNEDHEFAETRWMDSLSSKGPLRRMNTSRLSQRVMKQVSGIAKCQPEYVFAEIEKLGGDHGWYYANFLWRLRGFIDLLVGGVGMRRGRPHPVQLNAGDTVDVWRVENIQRPRLLRLRAEMKLPGRAWLQFEVEEHEEGSRVLQAAVFDPLGVAGRLYWFFLYPIHWFVFWGLLRAVIRKAEKSSEK